MLLQGSCSVVQDENEPRTEPAPDGGNTPGFSRGLGDEIVELPLLVTSDEAAALEFAAQAQGITVGRLLRSVIREGLAGCRSPLSSLKAVIEAAGTKRA